jgi:hypothetical protein
VLDADIANGGFLKPIKSLVIHTETQSLYCSMGGGADKPLKSKVSIFRADLGIDCHIIQDAFDSGLPSECHQDFSCTACHRFMKTFEYLDMVYAETGNLRPLSRDNDLQNDFYQNRYRRPRSFFKVNK